MIPGPSGTSSHSAGEGEGGWEGPHVRPRWQIRVLSLCARHLARAQEVPGPSLCTEQPIPELAEEGPSEWAFLLSNGQNNAHFSPLLKKCPFSLQSLLKINSAQVESVTVWTHGTAMQQKTQWPQGLNRSRRRTRQDTTEPELKEWDPWPREVLAQRGCQLRSNAPAQHRSQLSGPPAWK